MQSNMQPTIEEKKRFLKARTQNILDKLLRMDIYTVGNQRASGLHSYVCPICGRGSGREEEDNVGITTNNKLQYRCFEHSCLDYGGKNGKDVIDLYKLVEGIQGAPFRQVVDEMYNRYKDLPEDGSPPLPTVQLEQDGHTSDVQTASREHEYSIGEEYSVEKIVAFYYPNETLRDDGKDELLESYLEEGDFWQDDSSVEDNLWNMVYATNATKEKGALQLPLASSRPDESPY